MCIRDRGISLDEHTPRQLSLELVQAADVILTMTGAHKRAVLALEPQAAAKTFTLAEFAGASGDVLDPFGGDKSAYEACAAQIDALLAKSWEKIVKMAGDKA
ncbi:MAG: low molecular weight protein arginine phosphatase, partial [Negativicutes bacterium]|nr:low molecular weight protein arginine phosphatase [Negativicutes bacterium]